MPDLPTRREREAELASALFQVFDSWRPRFSAAKSSAEISWQEFLADVRQAVRDPMAEAASESAYLTVDSSQKNVPFSDSGTNEELEQRVAAWAEAHATNLAREITEITRAAAQLDNWDAWLGASRAETIAITETSRAITAGAVAAVGLMVMLRIIDPLKAFWATEADGRVCELCQPLDGEPETVWIGTAPGGPPAHPHCRCWLEWR